ncbi:hypothetical protein [Salinisphaera sp. LB1]|uniref:hypothetical protein n=1 Tax=Salinisphaera sp. LB1 TaxID=2183911 RepID=UPI0011AB6118|nr:hypothetical protein [Salinisphaera sp. LB1]
MTAISPRSSPATPKSAYRSMTRHRSAALQLHAEIPLFDDLWGRARCLGSLLLSEKQEPPGTAADNRLRILWAHTLAVSSVFDWVLATPLTLYFQSIQEY